MTTDHAHGYCWTERWPGKGGPRCTLGPGHSGNHLDWYADGEQREWPATTARPKPAARP